MINTGELTPEKQRILRTEGYILALGGPGSGKTFISLLKANHEIDTGHLKEGQSVLFLSFARSTISRVSEQAQKLISREIQHYVELDTYHGFAWKILKSHGYLLNGNTKIRLLPPHEAATRGLAEDEFEQYEGKRQLFLKEGILHFDMFATFCSELLKRSKGLVKIISSRYPIIIVDEFQDTNQDEWELIKTLGIGSTLIALADAEQRIYEFRGADPKRIGEFITEFSPTQFDFGNENNRSNGTDISQFGNDLLSEANKGKMYEQVKVMAYSFYVGKSMHYELKIEVFRALERIKKSGVQPWSVAVLVPTKRLMLEVSEYFRINKDELPPISHDVAIDASGPSLAAILISGLLDSKSKFGTPYRDLIKNLCAHIRGRNGNDRVSQNDEKIALEMESSLGRSGAKGKNRVLIELDGKAITEELRNYRFQGDPPNDWLFIRSLLEKCQSIQFKHVAEDAKHISLLRKGAHLSSRLSELWRTHGSYLGASNAVSDAILQEHFVSSVKEWKGIHVMTTHKSKGKEFDEVIVYEGRHQSRFVRANSTENDIAQARLTMRVAVTRAKTYATILTPSNDRCRLL